MNYKAFYAEVAEWINQCNQMAIQNGMGSEAFWGWVTKSTGELCNKYGNAELVIMQMAMLVDWLDGIYEKGRKK